MRFFPPPRTCLRVLRDVFLALLLIVLLGFPAQLNSILSKAGITQVNGGVFTWQQANQAADQGTAAAQADSSASDTLEEVESTLDDIASNSSDPISKNGHGCRDPGGHHPASLETANSSLAQSVVTLQTATPGSRLRGQGIAHFGLGSTWQLRPHPPTMDKIDEAEDCRIA